MPTAVALSTKGPWQSNARRDDVIFLGGGTFERRADPARTEIARKTFGRFSVRGPAAWRKDGGTGKNSNTMRSACKGLALPPCATTLPPGATLLVPLSGFFNGPTW